MSQHQQHTQSATDWVAAAYANLREQGLRHVRFLFDGRNLKERLYVEDVCDELRRAHLSPDRPTPDLY